jgi:putative hydrolase of the HAD superfamily
LSIRWIVFDAVGTLIYPTPKVGRVYFEIARAHGSALSESEIAQRFSVAFASSEQADLGTTSSLLVESTTSEEREVARWQDIVAEVVCDLENTTACFEELFEHFGKPTAWNIFDDVADTITNLKSAGYQIAIASNFDKRLHSVCEGHAAISHIQKRFVSSEIGFRKPVKAFYSAIIDACGADASETLMVGDGVTNDVQGALDAGWQAIHIDRTRSANDASVAQDLLNPSADDKKSHAVVRSLLEIQELLS